MPEPGVHGRARQLDPAAGAAPDARLAGRLAAAALGAPPLGVRRFTTGSTHHVFEVVFAGLAPVVVRATTEENRSVVAGAARLSRLLRPRGVPLPELLAEDLDGRFPYLILRRLPGSDLGHFIKHLPSATLDRVAAGIVQAQAAAAGLPSEGRYGYATSGETAPHSAWSHVLDASLARSRSRITAARLFDAEVVEKVAALVAATRSEIDAVPAVPFLHDTTTKNVIVTPDGTFSGIVDVDDLCFGDPRYAAALTLAALKASGGPVRYVEAWMRRAGLEADRVFRIYVALFLVDLMSEHGQRFNGNERSSTAVERERLRQAFALALRET